MTNLTLTAKLSPHPLPSFDYADIPDTAVAQRAQAAVLRIRELQRGAIVDIGRELIKVKEELDHGLFLKWLDALDMNRRTATNYMAAANAFGDKWETVSHLPANVIYKLASPNTAPEVREAASKLPPGQSLRLGTIEFANSQVEKARSRKERSTKEFKQAAERQRADQQAEVATRQPDPETKRVRAAAVAEGPSSCLEATSASCATSWWG